MLLHSYRIEISLEKNETDFTYDAATATLT